ncbi:GntR family transcriptional regulator [Testudinibacter sp. TR-2022]|uniref:GntR family transcriptional regulator n=1 Tax=Testudinibacter sp. TR-2022 TaxID=2585029 RepID=UPI001118AACB|nr:GntR family transcriptional regulator [Testudinibacter sp. TR-2022]TNH01990.1 GntR family transcriptional regulator [Pasteurellaceae bacterium Phil31]TNH04895.1 GntR family transcriptional regulator [Testudinibacter sp. TR-2022]TNH09942.1 GntR family transcriptional regulator [Testudinibacter sp. TR-2022]TNH14453.1 GntR family transcriptional regulator [Testudinibacter sp. TR-2022]TNH17048.1 GntR family transcriptional regulator [Testudinibacter sp. TR-2022]
MSAFENGMLKPLKKKKLSEHIYDEIERLIVTDELKEGEALPSERDLMEIFGVGRPSVREALQKLEQKGLVEIKSGEKTRVTRPCTETVINNISGIAIGVLTQQNERIQLEKIRQLFEIAVVREAARVRTAEDLKQLQLALANNKVQLSNYDGFIETDVRFHLAILGCLHNPMALQMYSTFIDWLIKARSKEKFIELHEQSYIHHCCIYQAIEAGLPDKAEQYMRQHLQYVMDNT